MKKILTVMGTRPEIIKLAPVIRSLKKYEDVKSIVLSTGQHREMSDQFLEEFDIEPEIDLDIMKPDQSVSYVASKMAENFEPVLNKIRPDVVLVQGDTITAAMGGLISYFHKIAVGHVEAGLRTNNIYFPHPEEINRQIISRFAAFNFVPTLRAAQNLISESVDEKTIHYVGNTVVDSLRNLIQSDKFGRPLENGEDSRMRKILVTAHRRENFGQPMINICEAINDLTGRFDDIKIIFPVHPNPNVRNTVYAILKDNPAVELHEPFNYLDLVKTIERAAIVLTDSGGIQEEAPTFHKPVLVMRSETERPEGVEAGIARLVGTDRALIVDSVSELLTDSEKYRGIAVIKNPYGDGKASLRIINILRSHLGLKVKTEVEPLEQYYERVSERLEDINR